MRALLDTHALLWWLENSRALGAQARAVIGGADNELYLSMASIWELAIKLSLGKLQLTTSLEVLIRQDLPAQGIRVLPIDPDHCLRVERLPYHHRDPFDRMLVAQALCESLTFLSREDRLDAYGIHRLW